MHLPRVTNHVPTANSFRPDFAQKIIDTADRLVETGQTSFTHLELLGGATTSRPFSGVAISNLRHMIATGELIATVTAEGAEYLRSKNISSFLINRLVQERSSRLSETTHLSALTLSLPDYDEGVVQAAA
jgi:hypothetical protein